MLFNIPCRAIGSSVAVKLSNDPVSRCWSKGDAFRRGICARRFAPKARCVKVERDSILEDGRETSIVS